MKSPAEVPSSDAADDDHNGLIPISVNGDILQQDDAEVAG